MCPVGPVSELVSLCLSSRITGHFPPGWYFFDLSPPPTFLFCFPEEPSFPLLRPVVSFAKALTAVLSRPFFYPRYTTSSHDNTISSP
jgi:hypothetical protein